MSALERDPNLLHTLMTCAPNMQVIVRGFPMNIGVHERFKGHPRRVYLWADAPKDESKIDAEHHLDHEEEVVYVRRPSDSVALFLPEHLAALIGSGTFWI